MRVRVRVGVRVRVRARVTLASGGRVLHGPAHHQARVAVAARAQVVERDDALVNNMLLGLGEGEGEDEGWRQG